MPAILIHVLLALLLLATPAAAQSPEQAQRAPQPEPSRFEESVEVVGVTPIDGLGLPKYKVPANVQVFTADRIVSALALDVPTLLSDRAASVHLSEPHAGTFQPDLLFRGFVASPLLGASEGLAVYQDGVRVNEAFGDTVNWDALPAAAIASINVMPGSNPLFGLNALGGALSIRTKDGFAFPGGRAVVSTGSFGRNHAEAVFGGHGQSFAYLAAGSLTDEAGWRDHSPSTIRRFFGDVAWRGAASQLNIGVTAASNDLTGNGTAPVDLLDEDARAVFTHPDRTDNDIVLLTTRGRRQWSRTTHLEGVAYYRNSRIATFNGDAADLDNDDDNTSAPGAHPGLDGINNVSHTRGDAAGFTAQITRTAPVRGRDNQLIVGAGLDAASTRFDFASELARLTPTRGTVGSGVFEDDAFVNLHSRTVTASVFTSNTWSVSDDIALTGSARFNWTEVRLRDQIGTALNGDHTFGRINPGVGITYQLRRGLNLYGSYSQSSRVPTPVELTCADPEDPCRLPNAFVSDPPLNQVVARTWEAGARGGTGRATWSVSAFTSAATDDIIFVSSGTLRGEGHFENIERSRRDGLEASFDYEVRDRFSTFAAYTLQRARFGTDLVIASPFHPTAVESEIAVTSGSRLPGVPAHVAKLGVAGAITAGLNIGMTMRAQSGQYLRGDEANLLTPLPGFAVVNAHARQKITSRVTAVAQLHNLLDARYYTFGGLGDAELLGEDFEDEPRFYSPGAPRSAWIGLEVRF